MPVVQCDEMEVERATLGDDLFFPNVNSCLAYIMLFYRYSKTSRFFSCVTGATGEIGGHVVGGHVVQTQDGQDYQQALMQQNVDTVRDDMIAEARGISRKMKALVVIGPLDYWPDGMPRSPLGRIRARFSNSVSYHTINTSVAGGGVDICLDCHTYRLHIVRHQNPPSVAYTKGNSGGNAWDVDTLGANTNLT
jgi:hypothetical protein